MNHVSCRCPVCNQTADYPARYAWKWHRCKAGCAGTTRLVIVPDGTAILEAEIDARWQRAITRGKAARWALVAVGVGLVLGPLWLARTPLAGAPAGFVAACGLGLAIWAARAALSYWCRKPPGL